MTAKAFLVLCASALLVKTISGQFGCGYSNLGGAQIIGAEIAAAELANVAYGGCGVGIGAPIYSGGSIYGPQIASSGGGLAISSASPIYPNGISVLSENAIEGLLAVQGNLPLLAAVALEGNLPTAGAAGVSYSCGNGNVGISSDSLAAAGIGSGAYGSLGLANAGLAGINNAGLVGINNAGLYGLNNAGLAGINAGLIGNSLIGAGPSCGCGGIYY